MADKRWHIHDLPEPDVLAALGRVATRHGFLNHVLIRTIKTIRGMSVEEADTTFAKYGSGRLRGLVQEAAVKRFGAEAPATQRLCAMLGEVERVTVTRNLVVHGLWARDMDSDQTMLIDGGAPSARPAAAELDRLADEILNIASAINHSRFNGGFLEKAVQRRT